MFDFGANAVVEKLETVPEQFRPLYVEKEGKFALAADDPKVKGAVEALSGLGKALKAARDEAKGRAPVDLSPLKEFGGSPEEIAASVRTRLEELSAAAKGGTDAKLNIEKIKADLAKAHSTELTAREKRIEALTGQLYGHLVESEAKGAIASEKGDLDLLLPFVKQRVKVVEEDGKVQVFVVDDAGDRRYSGVTGTPMSIRELVREMKAAPKFGKLFESETPKGSGHRPGSAKTQTGGTREPAQRSSLEKIQAGLERRGRG
jgi:hypothetical protein